MTSPTGDKLDDIHFLVTVQTTCSTTAAARCHQCAGTNGPAHAASTRLLNRWYADGNASWEEGQHGGAVTTGWLMIDDTTRDTPYRRAIALVRRHWSGNQHRVVVGSNRIGVRWTDGEAHLPGAVRISDNAHDGVSTTDHVPALVTAAAARGCQPHLLGFASWSSYGCRCSTPWRGRISAPPAGLR